MIAETVLKPAPAGRPSPDRKPAPVLIQKAAVLGAGTMGSRIAAHLANAGVPVVLLDIAGPAGRRSTVAEQALEALKKAKPAAFFDTSVAGRIAAGNFEDHLGLLRDCDWVIEAVTENLAIKQPLLEKVAPKPDAILTTNTSGLPVVSIAASLPPELRARSFGTHFFNPPRYMRLVEIIAMPETDPHTVEAISAICRPAAGQGRRAGARHAQLHR
jgi:3-hydroxyacyl-CoA dehydrogenase